MGAVAWQAMLPAAAEAQQVMMLSSSVGAPGRSGPDIPRGSVDKYAELLGLDEGQREMALALHEGYVAAIRGARSEMQEGMREIRAEFEESRDPSVWERASAIQEAYANQSAKIEQGFFADLRSLLSDGQSAAWEKVERHRRREVGLRGGSLSGESVDLIALVDGLKLADGRTAELDEALEAYEAAMDRALAEKAEILREMEQDRPRPGQPMAFDAEQFQEMLRKGREAGQKVVDVNETYARRIKAAMAETHHASFDKAYRVAAFPEVYRETYGMRCLSAALGFEDLSADQRTAIAELKSSVERELEAINERHRQALVEQERNSEGGAVMLGGAMMRMQFGEEDEGSPVGVARKEKRELDERARERLAKILRPEQVERLPKRSDTEQRGVPGAIIQSDSVIIHRGG
jgi:hypothetical protein